MASAFTHGFTAIVLGKVLIRQKMPTRFWWLMAFCAIVPDADVIGFAFGIKYGDLLGHRGLTHSMFFALFLGCLVTTVFFRQEKLFSKNWLWLSFLFTLSGISHGVLDALTNGGLGIAFFSPIDQTRYFFPFRPVQVAPIGIAAFFSEWGIEVMLSEFLWIWLPFSIFYFVVLAYLEITHKKRL